MSATRRLMAKEAMLMEGREPLRDRWRQPTCHGLVERGRRNVQRRIGEGNEKSNPTTIHVSTVFVGEGWDRGLFIQGSNKLCPNGPKLNKEVKAHLFLEMEKDGLFNQFLKYGFLGFDRQRWQRNG